MRCFGPSWRGFARDRATFVGLKYVGPQEGRERGYEGFRVIVERSDDEGSLDWDAHAHAAVAELADDEAAGELGGP